MAHYEGYISQDGIDALHQLFGHHITTVYTPQVDVSIDGNPPEAHIIVLLTGCEPDKFVTISTDWHTTESYFDYHTFLIESAPLPGPIPYKRGEGMRSGTLGPASYVSVGIGELEQVQIIEALCHTTDPEPGHEAETVYYDRGIRFIGASRSFLLCSEFNSISGSIQISRDEEMPSEDMDIVEEYRIRQSFGSP